MPVSAEGKQLPEQPETKPETEARQALNRQIQEEASLPGGWLCRTGERTETSLRDFLAAGPDMMLTEKTSGLPACEQPLPFAQMKPRLAHVLQKASVSCWKDLLDLSIKQVRQLPGMGAKSLEQLESLLQASLQKQPVLAKDAADRQVLRDMAAHLSVTEQTELLPLLESTYAQQAVLPSAGSLDLQALVSRLADTGPVQHFLEQKVLSYCEKALPRLQVIQSFSPLLQPAAEHTVYCLLENRQLFETPLGLVQAQSPLEDWLASRMPLRCQVLQLRLQEGLNLEKTGEKTGLSPRQVRQIQAREMAGAPRFPFSWLLPYFETYAFSLEEAREIFGLEPAEARYLQAAARQARPVLSAEQMLEEPDLSGLLYRRLHRFVHRTDLQVDGQKIPRQRKALLRHLIRREASAESQEISVLYAKYEKLLHSLGLEQESTFVFASPRNFELYLYQEPWTVSGGRHRVRWYDTSRINWPESVRRMNLEQYQDQAISARLIFEARLHQMELLDIRDCYELHHILKKTRPVWDPQEKADIVFERSPSLVFGQGSREKQIRLLLEELAPVSRDDLAAAYAERYGDLQSTVMVNVLPLVKEHLDQGMYVLEQPELSEAEQAWVKELLAGEPASLDWLRKQAAGKIREERSLYARSLAAAGYVMKTGYVLPQDSPDPEDCLLKMARKRGHFHFRQDLRGLGAIPRFVQALGQLRSSMQLYECAPSVYESPEVWLARWPGLDPSMLEDYLESSRNFASKNGMRRFNDFGLRHRGFVHPVYETGVSSEQLDLLRKNTRQMVFQRTGGQLLFGEKSFSASSMIYRALSMQEGQSAAQLQKMSQEWWNMAPPLDKVEEVLHNTGFYQHGGLWYTSREAWSAAAQPTAAEETESGRS